ncbi:flavodoxin family protein [Fusobacterium russii]|uniref:flavodoxin family protein n=1 Tax=Fusobacterium russii TaxID=854 RepID=UPI0003A1D4F8|nr:flavodoxin family protein [Fusobacterium russii]
MKILIVYSSLTGNTKKVCEKAFEYLNCEKEITAIETVSEEKLNSFENIIIGTWIDKATADEKARKLLKKLSGKNLYFIGTLAAALDSEHAKKCFNNLSKLCAKNNYFKTGVLARGRVSEDLQEKFNKFPLNIIHKFVPNMHEIILEAESHPNESDFDIIKNFISVNFNNL